MKTILEFRVAALKMLEPMYGDREARAIVKMWFCSRLELSSIDLVVLEQDRVEFPSFVTDSTRLQAHEPIQYILGTAPFMDLELRVNPSTLIPRPETEELVHYVAERHGPEPKRVLDAGTGSGCIALGLKSLRPRWEITGLDISETCIRTAQQNATTHGLQVSFERADVLQGLPKADLIVSNPPYIPASERVDMDVHVTEQEPHRALFVPDHDPLLFYRTLVEQGKNQCQGNGVDFAFEIHENFGDQMLEMCAQLQLKEVNLKVDFQNKPRFIFARYDG